MPDPLLPDPTCAPSLMGARNALHAAAQVPAALGTSRLHDTGDFLHTVLLWHAKHRALVGRVVDGVRAGLVVPTMSWVVIDDRDRIVQQTPASGMTLEQGLRWLEAHTPPDGPVTLGTWEAPPHPAAREGATLPEVDPELLDQLARWYALADDGLQRLRGGEPRASEVRVWPHHFDVATLITLDGDADDPDTARSVGVGMTPGDGGIGEPYWYVLPWPTPDPTDLPPLHVGGWHTEGWVGAVLRGSEVGDAPGVRVAGFVAAAVEASITVVGG